MPRAQQAESHPGFVAPDARFDCNACVTHHGEKWGFPHLDADNQFAFEMYQIVESQVRVTGMGEVLGLDYPAVFQIFDEYGLDDDERRPLFDKILVIDAEFREYRRRVAEMERHQAQLAKQWDNPGGTTTVFRPQ